MEVTNIKNPDIDQKQLNTNLKLFIDFCKNSMIAHDVDPAISYLNYMVERMEMNEEQVLWLCFLYGVTYQLPSAYLIWNEYPDLELAGIDRLNNWWKDAQRHIPFQTDKMKQRKDFVKTVASYQDLVGGSQRAYFDDLLSADDPQVNFDKLWSPLKTISYFGRFSVWNWTQALKHVAGYNIEPTILMLGEPDSISFTDGLAYAFGLLNKTTQKIINPETGKKQKIYYKWSEEEKIDMENSCSALKKSLRLDNFQLETLACAFKKIWRTHESRYVGYYNDRMADDICKTSGQGWDGVDWQLLWDAREACVPKKYLHNNCGVNKAIFSFTPEQKIYM